MHQAFAVLGRHAHRLGGAKRLLIEGDGLDSASHRETGDDRLGWRAAARLCSLSKYLGFVTQEPMDLARRSGPIVRPAIPLTEARPCFVVLDDHARLPWRFFGRLTAAIQAGL